MTLLMYIMLVKIYCEVSGNYADIEMLALIGLVMWLGHCVVKYLCK